ncbi:MAG: flagellar regulator YcgR PilZN domain-containing protein [Pseudomonadota bacterium]
MQDFTETSQQKIRQILTSLTRSRAHLTAEIGHGVLTAPTLSLHVDTELGVFLIDTFNNGHAMDLVRGGKPFSLRGSDNGVQVYCGGLTVIDLVRFDAAHALKVALPESIHYYQRRATFRVDLDGLADIPASLGCTPAQVAAARSHAVDPNAVPDALVGRVIDLSTRGCRVVFTDQVYPVPSAGIDDTVTLRLRMPDREGTLDLPVMWRFKKHSIADSTLVVGLEFGAIDERTVESIQQFVVSMQFKQRAVELQRRCA